jgi:DNA-binding response OmpR family regulator
MPHHILVADDDPHIREVICFALEKAGMKTSTVADGAAVLRTIERRTPDLIVLDIGMPEMDGLEVCRRLRHMSDVPVLFLSARDEEIDRILGLEMGGDDYVTKPFSPRELVARVKAVRERVGPNIRMTVDANCRYEVKSAIHAIEEAADYGVELIEQPVPRGNREGMALITRTVRPMVEADESAQNYDEILDLVRHRVVDCINLRLSRLGGVKAVMDAARVCESGDIKYRFGLMLMPSHFQAATLHVASVLPYLPVGHEIGEHELFREDLFEPLPIVDGMAAVPTGPGVGPRLRNSVR